MDIYFFNIINSFAGRWWALDWLGIFLANYLGYFLVAIAILILIKEKDRRRQIYFFSLVMLSVIISRGIITEIIRFFYYRPRPFLVLEIKPLISHISTASFPSGHAAAFFALALAVFYFNKKVGWWFLISAVFMGLARIFVGVHWPSDILAGMIVGLGSVWLVRFIFKIER
ncbi:MAG: phosphatase PAP2 family protein [Patescibacteria group bacterium]